MPLLKIKIDDEDVEFKIMPINKNINNKIVSRFSHIEGDFFILDRGAYLSHIVKEPKMTKNEWIELPSSLIDKIIRNVNAYIESIYLNEEKLRIYYMNLSVYEKELDDLYRYLQEDVEDWVWERINIIEKNISNIKEKMNKIEKSLEFVKSDYVLFEEGKEMNYDVQSLQLEYKK